MSDIEVGRSQSELSGVEEHYRPPREVHFDPGGELPLSKSDYILRVIFAVFALVVAQFVIPTIAMVVMMPIWFDSMFNRDIEQLQAAAAFDGDLFLVKGAQNLLSSDGAWSYSLHRLDLADPVAEPVKVAELEMAQPELLVSQQRLWLYSKGTLSTVEGGAVRSISPNTWVEEATPPFSFEGSPAIVELTSEGQSLKVFRGGVWQEQARQLVPLEVPTRPDVVLSAADGLHSFIHSNDGVMHLRGLPGFTPDEEHWDVAAETQGFWAGGTSNGEPVVFFTEPRGSKATLRASRLVNGAWAPFFESERSMVNDVFVAPKDDGGFTVVLEGFPGTLEIVNVSSAGELLSERRVGEGFNPFGGVAFVPLTVGINVASALVLIPFVLYLSAIGRRFKKKLHISGDRSAPYATLNRRALAKVIDGAIIWGPTMVGALLLLRGYSDFERMLDPSYMAVMMGSMFGGYAWAFLSFIAFSISEGLWGRTPGKKIARIRVVGVDFERCGVGRAVLRNIILYGDAMMMGAVGGMCVALTEKWQRLGDLATKTVVLSDSS